MSRHRILACLCCISFTALVSIADAGVMNYQGSMKQGTGNGARWSLVHAATGSAMTPPGGWAQFASGNLHFEMTNNVFDFEFEDFGNDGLNAGDEIRLNNIVVNLQAASGSGTAQLTLGGTLVVGAETGLLSPLRTNYDFTNFLKSDASGLSYKIDGLSGNPSIFSDVDVLEGIAYFQDAFFAGPFNGIKMDNGALTFAVWGDSHNSSGNTGLLNSSAQTPLGFDIFVESANPVPPPQSTPEPGSFAIFFGLALAVLAPRRQRIS